MNHWRFQRVSCLPCWPAYLRGMKTLVKDSSPFPRENSSGMDLSKSTQKSSLPFNLPLKNPFRKFLFDLKVGHKDGIGG